MTFGVEGEVPRAFSIKEKCLLNSFAWGKERNSIAPKRGWRRGRAGSEGGEGRVCNHSATAEGCLPQDVTLHGDARAFAKIYQMIEMFSMHDYLVGIGEEVEFSVWTEAKQ